MKTTLKKLTALVLTVGMMAGLITTSTTTVQASGYSYISFDEAQELAYNDPNTYQVLYDPDERTDRWNFSICGFFDSNFYRGIEPPASAEVGSQFMLMQYNSALGWYVGVSTYDFDGTDWVRAGDGAVWHWGDKDAVAADDAAFQEGLANETAAKEAGFQNYGQMCVAAEKNMSAFEYYNNVIINTPGIEEATPVGQGGKLIINGKESGITATFDKVDRSYVDSVRTQTDGTVLNVVKIGLPLADGIGGVITTNFYMPGVASGDEITVVQYIDGVWVEAAVTEIRADHIVLNLDRSGVIAFVRK